MLSLTHRGVRSTTPAGPGGLSLGSVGAGALAAAAMVSGAPVLALLSAGCLVANELGSAAARHRERGELYARGLAHARREGRTFVVVGDPDAGLHTRLARAYGCADLCVDLNGCPQCPSAVAADLTAGPIGAVPDDSAVVFVSCVLEYVSDHDAAWRELLRMAGDPTRIYVATVEDGTLAARLYPGARRVVTCAPPQCPTLVTRPVSPVEKAVCAGGVAALALSVGRLALG